MERPKLMPHEWFGRRVLFVTTAAAALAGRPRAARSVATSVEVGYLRWLDPRPTISLLDKPASDNGLAGAKLAMSDNNSTGRFMNQQFELVDAPVHADDDPVAILTGLTDRGITLIVTDLPADHLLKLADAGNNKHVTLFNVEAPDDALRQANCRTNVIHVAPSRAMLADALATAAFVLGPDEGIRLLDRMNVAGIIVTPDLARYETGTLPHAA